MNEHEHCRDLLAAYAAASLTEDECRAVERHLAVCADCRRELAQWRSIAGAVRASNRELAAPAGLFERTLAQARSARQRSNSFARATALLRAQAGVVRRELWPASAAVMLVGYAVALLSGATDFIRLLAPMLAAASIAMIYGPEHDPAAELVQATPVSAWKVLLARMTLVFGYDLTLATAVTLGLLPFRHELLLGQMILGWLGPLTFLSAVALLLSLLIGTANAIAVSYAAWIGSLFPWSATPPLANIGLPPFVQALVNGYQQFWSNPLWLMALSLPLIATALVVASRQEYRGSHIAPTL